MTKIKLLSTIKTGLKMSLKLNFQVFFIYLLVIIVGQLLLLLMVKFEGDAKYKWIDMDHVILAKVL